KKGELLIIGKRDTEYKGWVWITVNSGKQGWAPIQYLQIKEGPNTAEVKQDYNAKELDTILGEELTLHYELNDWGWVEKRDGSIGWIPMNTTKTA
ncbi:hypothetical protein MUO66_03160, partial [Candidatus Bathyarchaeota archaeon]|nr:hypothetical protein [Candidatus Bathyarchaeota archaeon]